MCVCVLNTTRLLSLQMQRDHDNGLTPSNLLTNQINKPVLSNQIQGDHFPLSKVLSADPTMEAFP